MHIRTFCLLWVKETYIKPIIVYHVCLYKICNSLLSQTKSNKHVIIIYQEQVIFILYYHILINNTYLVIIDRQMYVLHYLYQKLGKLSVQISWFNPRPPVVFTVSLRRGVVATAPGLFIMNFLYPYVCYQRITIMGLIYSFIPK